VIFNGQYAYLNGPGLFPKVDFRCSGTINGPNTFDTLIFSPGTTMLLQSSTIQTVVDSLKIRGNGCLPIVVHSTIEGNPAEIHKVLGDISGDFIELKDQTVTGPGTFYAGHYSTDMGGNTGWIFNNSAGYSYGLGPDATLCIGDSLSTNNFNGAISYLWSNGTTGSNLVINQPGNYSVTATYAENCTYTDDINITLKPTPVIQLPVDTAICGGLPVTLNATLPGCQYLWSTGSTSPSIIVTNPGNYSVTVTNSESCSDQDTIQVNSSPVPADPITSAAVSVCSGSTITLSINNTASYLPGTLFLWEGPDGFTEETGLAQPNLILNNVTPLQSGIYSVRTTQGDCTSQTIYIVVNIYPKPILESINHY